MPVEVQAPTRGARLLPQLVKSGAVGGVGFVVNLGVFNALMLTVFVPAHVLAGPIWATVLATLAAIVTNWLGNRFWAFSDQRQSNAAREGAEFMLVSIAGMGIPLACLWASHYLLGFTSLVSDNIANNGIGLVLGMLFRFALYRWWVFSPSRSASRSARRSAVLPGSRLSGASLPATPDPGLDLKR